MFGGLRETYLQVIKSYESRLPVPKQNAEQTKSEIPPFKTETDYLNIRKRTLKKTYKYLDRIVQDADSEFRAGRILKKSVLDPNISLELLTYLCLQTCPEQMPTNEELQVIQDDFGIGSTYRIPVKKHLTYNTRSVKVTGFTPEEVCLLHSIITFRRAVNKTLENCYSASCVILGLPTEEEKIREGKRIQVEQIKKGETTATSVNDAFALCFFRTIHEYRDTSSLEK